MQTEFFNKYSVPYTQIQQSGRTRLTLWDMCLKIEKIMEILLRQQFLKKPTLIYRDLKNIHILEEVTADFNGLQTFYFK